MSNLRDFRQSISLQTSTMTAEIHYERASDTWVLSWDDDGREEYDDLSVALARLAVFVARYDTPSWEETYRIFTHDPEEFGDLITPVLEAEFIL